jgi:hypothetical protein
MDRLVHATYGALLDRVDGVNPLLGPGERPLAERVVAICRGLEGRPRGEGGKLVADAGDHELKRELGKLTELLGRRASIALPAATLGRAALADLFLDSTTFRQVIADCDAKLALLGH